MISQKSFYKPAMTRQTVFEALNAGGGFNHHDAVAGRIFIGKGICRPFIGKLLGTA